MADKPHPTLPKRPTRPPPAPGTPEHQEWLIDEAVEESFPASDPSEPAQPGGKQPDDETRKRGRK